VNIPVFASLGAAQPSKVVVTTGENPANEVGISWETSLDITSGNLVIGKQGDLSDGKSIQAVSRDITTTLNSYQRMYKAWGAYAQELEPSTVYYYKVGQGGSYSDIKSFKTAPASGDVTIAFYGDVQGSYNKFPATIDALKAIYPETDLNLLAGDVADNGHIYSDWSAASEAVFPAVYGPPPSETMTPILTRRALPPFSTGPITAHTQRPATTTLRLGTY
jgi:phosphodiesterase/alkaline phosphatase D-like protein